MKSLDIKSEIKNILEQVNDVDILEAVKTILLKSSLDPVLKDKLSKRAMQSESDIKQNKLFGRDEVAEKTKMDLNL